MVKKILVAVEEFELAQKTVSKSIGLAKQLGAELGIINIISTDITLTQESAIMLNELKKNIKLKSENLIKDLKEKFDLHNVKTFFEEGPIVKTLINKSEKWNADIIVVGSNVRKGIDKWIMGSVAQEVLNKSKTPVLVITKNVK